MHKIIALLFCSYLLFTAQAAQAAFPVKVIIIENAAATPTPAYVAPSATQQTEIQHVPLFPKAKQLLQPFRDRWGYQPRSKKCGLSIISASLIILAYALLMAPVFIAALSATGILFCYGLALALGIGGFITGTVALAQRQRLKLLAIFGVTAGSEFVAGLLVLLILLAIW